MDTRIDPFHEEAGPLPAEVAAYVSGWNVDLDESRGRLQLLEARLDLVRTIERSYELVGPHHIISKLAVLGVADASRPWEWDSVDLELHLTTTLRHIDWQLALRVWARLVNQQVTDETITDELVGEAARAVRDAFDTRCSAERMLQGHRSATRKADFARCVTAPDAREKFDAVQAAERKLADHTHRDLDEKLAQTLSVGQAARRRGGAGYLTGWPMLANLGWLNSRSAHLVDPSTGRDDPDTTTDPDTNPDTE